MAKPKPHRSTTMPQDAAAEEPEKTPDAAETVEPAQAQADDGPSLPPTDPAPPDVAVATLSASQYGVPSTLETTTVAELQEMLAPAEPTHWRVLEDRQWWSRGASAQARKGDVVCRMTHDVDAMLQQKVAMGPCPPPGPLSYEARGIMPPAAAPKARPQLPTEPQRDGNTAAIHKGVTGNDLG